MTIDLRSDPKLIYAGLSYEAASRKATEVCRVGADTGMTIKAAEHLAELAFVMKAGRA